MLWGSGSLPRSLPRFFLTRLLYHSPLILNKKFQPARRLLCLRMADKPPRSAQLGLTDEDFYLS
jgi:hypothetical protein